ncbi:hypothetical protein I302_106929 [Kwoniella bestiolae CBS 10118]|uniref:Uncharacterized protein n=1 Tax=Kwoniella bestiolae CBS 10118 TaxID=1296100 RepID=A0A1B9G002_9TREE|nr:hypothetical protein I302_05805 [Kwoniella bestiolae CBS 10118]OCF24345.1 hypothetical protein I302_05805 [Kwoniella bestiolae CBS 10118]
MAAINTYPFSRTTHSTSPFVSSTPPIPTTHKLTTPLAPPPPPPLYMSAHDHSSGPERQVRYAGADHTLGPTFSEEEDGDDTAFIAAKMASLGLDPSGRPYNQNGYTQQDPRSQQYRDPRSRSPLAQAQLHAQRQTQMHYLTQQAQQQQALFHLLSQQNQTQLNPQMREAMAILELQQAQQTATDRHAYAQRQAQRAYGQAQRQPGWEQAKSLQQQQQQIREMQYLQDLHLQQQLAALQSTTNTPAYGRPNSERNALSAQMQANLQARQGRVLAQARGMTLDDSELRARFEAAENYSYTPPPPLEPRVKFDSASTSPTKGNSPTSPSWKSSGSPSPTKTNILTPTELPTPTHPTSSVRSPKGGRFAQARQAMAAEGTEKPYGTLTATLSGRSLNSENFAQTMFTEKTIQEKEEVVEAPASPTVEKKPLKYTLGALGNGRPSTVSSNTNRAVTLPVKENNPAQAHSQRAVSQPLLQIPSKVYVVRQPYGPPCEASELGDKNFQSRLRRQAGLNLTMLGRRTESPCPTPVMA